MAWRTCLVHHPPPAKRSPAPPPPGVGSNIGGLHDGQTYYAIVADASTIKLAATYHDATATATVPAPILLTSVGTSSSQTITPINANGREAFNPSTNVGGVEGTGRQGDKETKREH